MPPPRTKHAFDLLAIDLDGTLLNSEHRVPPENRDVLHRAHDAGLKIVLCTGRAHAETVPVLGQIGLDLDATVTSFGALITDVRTARTIASDPIPKRQADELSEWLLDRGYSVLWLVDRDVAGVDGYVLIGAKHNPAVDRWVSKTECTIRSIDRLSEAEVPPVRVSIIDETAILERESAEISRAFEGRIRHNVLRAPSYNVTVIEAFAPHVNKWYGIARICDRWGIDPRRTLALGDDVNDVDLLRSAGLGIAMGNAHPAAKAAAARTTATNDEAGVAQAIAEVLGL